MEGLHHDKPYNSKPWSYTSGGPLDSMPLSYVTRPTADSNYNMANIYNDFLKNDIDFSESPDPYNVKQEDNALYQEFDPLRNELDLNEVKFNRQPSDLKLGLDPTFDYNVPMPNPVDNRGSLFMNSLHGLERYDSVPGPLNDVRRSRGPSFHFERPEREEFSEIPQPQQLPPTQLPSYSANNYQESNIQQQYQSRMPPRLYTKNLETQFKPQPEQDAQNKMPEEPNSAGMSKLLSFFPTQLQIGTKPNEVPVTNTITPNQNACSYGHLNEYPSYMNTNINLNHPFLTQRKSSYQESQSTKTPSQCSAQSPGSAKQWTEIGMTLHNSTSKRALEAMSAGKKPKKASSGKKKVKLSKDDSAQVSPTDEAAQLVKQESLPENDAKPQFDPNLQESLKLRMHMSDRVDYRPRFNFFQENSNVSPTYNNLLQNNNINNNNMINPQISRNYVQHSNYGDSAINPPNMNNNSAAPLQNAFNNNSNNRVMYNNPQNYGMSNLQAQQQAQLAQQQAQQHAQHQQVQQQQAQNQVHNVNQVNQGQNQINQINQGPNQQGFPDCNRPGYPPQFRNPEFFHKLRNSFVNSIDTTRAPVTPQQIVSAQINSQNNPNLNKQAQHNSATNWLDCRKYMPGQNTAMPPRLNSQAVAAFLSQNNSKDLLSNLAIPREIEDVIRKSNILNKIQLAHRKRIGTLTIDERKAKIEKYLEKRKQRSWNKKISYQCRKRVADSRLRIKGRFVTREQASTLLGDEYDINTLTNTQIRDLLNAKFGETVDLHQRNGEGSSTHSGTNSPQGSPLRDECGRGESLYNFQ